MTPQGSAAAGIEVLFVAGFGPVTQTDGESQELYEDILGIDFEADPGGYLHTGGLDGVKYFALWPLDQAAESVFGTATWPDDVPVPSAWIEFDVADLAAATEHLRVRGYRLLVADRQEPWGQRVTRFLSRDGLLVGLTVTPWFREPQEG